MLNLMPDNVLELIASIYSECLRHRLSPSPHRSCLVSPIPKKEGDTAFPEVLVPDIVILITFRPIQVRCDGRWWYLLLLDL